MSNKTSDTMDGVFNASDEKQPAGGGKPARPPKAKVSLGRDTKVGLGVLAALLVIFAIVLVIRLKGNKDDDLAGGSGGPENPDVRKSSDEDKPAPKSTKPTTLSATTGSGKDQTYWDGTRSKSSAGQMVPGYGASAYSAGGSTESDQRPSRYLSPNESGRPDPTASQTNNASDRAAATAFDAKTADPFATSGRGNIGSFDSAYGRSASQAGTSEAAANDLANDNPVGPTLSDAVGAKQASTDNRHASGTRNNPFERAAPVAREQDSSASKLFSSNVTGAPADTSGLKFATDGPASSGTSAGNLSPVGDVVLQPTPSRLDPSNRTTNASRDSSEAPPFDVSQRSGSPAADTSAAKSASARGGQASAIAKNPSQQKSSNSSSEAAAKFVAPRKSLADPARLDESLTGGDDIAAPSNDRGAAASGDAYVVQANDTYWTIAQRTYGSGAYFKAIYEHNRRSIQAADHLQAGTRLLLPDEATLQRLYPELCPKPLKNVASTARATRASADLEIDGSAYVVEDGDTLYDIARRQLGKSSRWAEIYELNRESIGEPTDRLARGTRLRLPEQSTADRGQATGSRKH